MGGEKNSERIRRKILMPLTFTLVFFLVLFLLVSYAYLQKNIRRDLDQQYKTADILLREMVHQRSELMELALRRIAAGGDLQAAMQSGDNERLLRLATPMAEELSAKHGITHLYFHTPDGITFLRAHQPDRQGDPVVRETFQRARRTMQPAQGIELGPYGTFSLRVVVPWKVDGRLVGYLEAAEEMEYLFRKLHEISPFDIVLFLRKSLLSRSMWEEGMHMLGRAPEWDRFPHRVTAFHSLPEIPARLVEILRANKFEGRGEIAVEDGGRQLRGRLLPLLDVSHRRVGEILILRDVSRAIENFRQAMVLVTLFCLLFGGTLFASAFFLLGRTDLQLAFARRQLVDEIERAQQANRQLEREVEERRQAEAALKETRDLLEIRVGERTAELGLQNKLLSNLIRHIDDVLFAVDGEGRIVLMNPSAESFLGVRLEHAVRRRLEAVVTNMELIEKIKGALAEHRPGHFDLEAGTGGLPGHPRILQARTSMLGDEGGMIFLLQDVTSERTMDRLKSDFISTAAHELRTPMTVILGYSELLLNETLGPEEQREFLSVIFERADAVSSLLDDLLDISRIESGLPLMLRRDRFPVGELIDRTVDHYRKSAPNHRIELILDDAGVCLEVDRGKIWQVMENLVNNAVKYSPGGGSVQIRGNRMPEGYRVTVRDHGIGMTPEQVRQVFQKFFRADTSNTAIHGTGLGLTIVKHIVEAHGGHIWLESEPGKGTAVNFLLPV